MRRLHWRLKRAMISLPVCQQRALDRIGKALGADDPGLGLRFAVFTKLTAHEAMPGTEQVTSRLQRLLRPAMILPVTLITLLALLTASWLVPVTGQGCPAGQNPTPRSACSVSRTGSCELGTGNQARLPTCPQPPRQPHPGMRMGLRPPP